MRTTKLAAPVAAVVLCVVTGCGGSDDNPSSKPDRIVSISATGTEDLYAIGAGSQVVAVDDYSTYPKQAPRTKLSGYTPNAEAIAAYKPDLVVTADDTNHVVEALRKLGIRVLLDPAARNLDAAYAQLEQLGRATGREDEASRVITRMRTRIAAITLSLPKRSRPLSVYHELDGSYYSATSGTFVGSVYRLAGLTEPGLKAKKAAPFLQLLAADVA